MMTRLIAYFLATISFSSIVIAAEQTYVREYTYQASEADSKITARAIALQEVKRELLNELGTHVSSLVKQQSSSDGTQLGTEEIETLSAGVTRVEILDEKWNGAVYVLKAQIKADPADVLKSLNKMLDADKKQKQISQLGGDISRIQTEKIQIAESLTQSKKETNSALAEIARLKKQLAEQQTEASRQRLQSAYQQQVDQLSLNELLESAWINYSEGKYPAAIRLFKKAAEQGHAYAQFFLGVMHDKGGIEVARDPKQAAYWYQKAAEQGNAFAQFLLADMYGRGDGVPRDDIKAVEWYRKAAEQGNAFAQYYLAVRLFKGMGVSRDSIKAAEWCRKAAEQGNAKAQHLLAIMYARGDGVPKDDTKAVEWYQEAAKQNNADAQLTLGIMYANGEGGVQKDSTKAASLIRKAAAQGYGIAQSSLASMYVNGQVVSKDYVRAYAWSILAAAQGDETGKQIRNYLEPLLTGEQRAEGQRLASSWKYGDTLDGN